ncbi:uncharacterized protein FOBCDRAFT_291182 [Fusarium oxysporum Fo47]|uniref:DUF6604 domain-containing protein n=1 Tax=Fusarium oxysporum Fo47 TaxID=660027 RepID=W9KGQ3_FUSOX|nr:uncharacterized protein FOBCDRAFT_291182 [Fusarium oxysporum Fo47]EWZ41145.1 hypothetical protein FOZG_06554 [Fusarium oxysporum Fo47]WJG35121.1 hypothetical protein FOBCDRAFT_291182 [Fusarium oxysporum Fo47]
MLSPAYMTNTAKAHGHDADGAVGAAALDTLKKRKKSKGNGKGKGPIRAKNKKTQEKQDPSTKKYVIRVRDFEAMAKHVAETNAVAVPHRTAFDDHSLRSSQRAVQEGIAAGASYSHFVEVLEKVRGYLKPIMEADLFKSDDLDKKTDIKTNHTAKGMFDVLNVYTPSEEFLNASDITPTPTTETQYTVEEEVAWEDAFFAFTALLRDYGYLSQEIHSLWVKYAKGELDLAAVALATNTAFEFAHSIEMDIKKVMDKFGGTTVFAHLCFEAACEGLGIDKERNSPGAMYNLAAYDVAKVLTLDIMGDVEDELVRGIGAALKEKKENPRLWISWALQMYLDIVQGLGESIGRGYEQFKQESLKIQKALVDLPKTAERRQVLQVATRWNHDPIYETNQSMMEFGAMAHSDDNVAFPFLRRNPIYCGLLIHHTRAMLHVNGGRIPEGQAWEGLEEFWGYQGNPCFFVGNPSKDLEGYYNNYCLCLGTSLTHWAPNTKLDGWVSLSLDSRICVDNPHEPWTIATVGELLTECLKKAMMDGKGHIKEDLKQKAKEANLEAVPKSPSGFIE